MSPKMNRRERAVVKTNTRQDNQFFYKETFFGDESSDANSSNSDEDTESLFLRARELVNDEFRLMTINPDQHSRNDNATPKQLYKKSVVKKTMASVQDTRKQIRQEWNALKNASLINDNSAGETLTVGNPKDPRKEILLGVVAYIEIGLNKQRVSSWAKILKFMGATVLDTFAQEVTHVVYKKGNNDTFRRAKLLNAFLVSVLWVEACYSTGHRVSEKLYPVKTDNKYGCSPRLFRKYLESRKELQLQCVNAHLSSINQQKPQSSNQNDNIDKTNKNPASASEISGIVKFKEPLQKLTTVAVSKANDNNSSDDSIRLHLSSDDSESDESADQSTLTDQRNVPDPKRLLRPSPTKALTSNVRSETNANVDSVPIKNTSPCKRKLFDKNTLQASYVLLNDRESTDSLKLIAKNPYQTCDDQNTKTGKIDTADKPDSTYNTKEIVQKPNTTQPVVFTIPQIPRKKLPPKREKVFKPLRSSGRSPRKSYNPPRSWPKLVSTSLHRFENASLGQSVLKLGRFRWASKVDEFTTHVVAGGPYRTVNLLKAVARGCWVVSRDWVLQSEIAGRWVTEDIYELKELAVVNRSRTQKQALGKDFNLNIFGDCGHIYISPETNPPRKDLQELVNLCGGRVTPNLSVAAIVVGKVEGAHQKCVTVKWILDSIISGRYKSINNYYFTD